MKMLEYNEIIFSNAESREEPIVFDTLFENERFFEFVDEARENGVTAPIYAGVTAITSVEQLGEISRSAGVELPKKYAKLIEKFCDRPDAFREAGIAFTVSQIVDLIARGVDGIHLCTTGSVYVAERIYDAVQNLISVKCG